MTRQARRRATSTRKYLTSLIVVLAVFFVTFVVVYESHTRDQQRGAVEAYARVISKSLWHFEPEVPTDYLSLIASEQDYERFRVLTDSGLDFVDVQTAQPDPWTRTLIALELIRRMEITAVVAHQGRAIGSIQAIWLNKNIYVYFYALILIALVAGIFWLYWRILHSNRELEVAIQRRTAELARANVELGASEIRYRSIFEDSPVSLREEDFSEVKQIIDDLHANGVTDLQAHFDAHPEAIEACVRAVKVLNVNQNTLELFKTDSKERLYRGLSDIFSEESLSRFGQQLVAFAQGLTHFECETVQRMVTGQKFWVGTSVSIAPGYEHTWEKVLVSILDITNRKQAEAELENYRGHLEDLVTARTTELVALQHRLEQRVVERTEELAQVNVGLNAEIIERRRLQDEVQRYAEELEQRVADRTRELSVLYDVTAVASNVEDRDTLLTRLLERSLAAVRRRAGIIQLVDESTARFRLTTLQNVTEPLAEHLASFFTEHADVRAALEAHTSFVIADLAHDPRLPAAVATGGWRTLIAEPIQDTRGRLIGVLSLFDDTGCPPNVEELTLLASIADHIGLAVENVRLRSEAEKSAVLEDRQRLARELHDAVSQSLFSASVIAETLPRLWERNPRLVQQSLGDLHRLIRSALTEMRILLLELRPVSMADAVLGDLLRQLVDGLKGRTQLDVTLSIDGQGEIPILVKKNLFRIAQEALNNVVKHAQAECVALKLDQHAERTALQISDNGQGFSPQDPHGGHLGLQIMNERAEEIGAALSIISQAGSGTQILAIWPRPAQ
ncbi:MAG TPA: histidine kinase [Anaerolineales bacterium]|nr:histidine kinase [Anaerolineales bacterium]HRF48174.1 histidine kinase [Anaerolineales bacterium]